MDSKKEVIAPEKGLKHKARGKSIQDSIYSSIKKYLQEK